MADRNVQKRKSHETDCNLVDYILQSFETNVITLVNLISKTSKLVMYSFLKKDISFKLMLNFFFSLQINGIINTESYTRMFAKKRKEICKNLSRKHYEMSRGLLI